MAPVKGETVAAIAPMPPGAPEGRPPMWNTYIAVDDIDATVEKVGPAGGQVLMHRRCRRSRPDGVRRRSDRPGGRAVAGQPPHRRDAGRRARAPIWNELITDKPESALAFYEAVVGVCTRGGDGTGAEVQPAQGRGTDVGGCMEPPMPGVPNHWHVYFAVHDADTTATKASEGGGQVTVEPFDIPTVGRSAVLVDPQGAAFSVLKPAQQIRGQSATRGRAGTSRRTCRWFISASGASCPTAQVS